MMKAKNNQLRAAIAIGFFTIFMPLLAMAEPLNLYAGKAGGGYDAAMKRMSSSLSVQGFQTTVINTTGSEEIVNTVCASGGVGLAQADAVARAQLSGCQVEVIADYNRQGEYVVYMYPPKGTEKFRNLKKGQTVATDLIGSGSDTTLRNIRQFGREQKKPTSWSEIEVTNLEPLMAIAGAKQGKVHGIVLVRATLNDPTFQIFLDNGWEFGEMWVDDLQDGFKSGSAPIYTEVKERTASSRGTWMYKVPAFYIAKGVDPKVQSIILNEAYR